MAVPAATFQTYQQKGIREDLSNAIYDISPTEKPFTSAIRKTKAEQSLHEWQKDSLAAASPTASAIVEGDDATANTADPTVRLKNYLQTLRKVVRVSGKARAVNTAGRKDEFKYQLKKRMAELGRDLEAAYTQNNAATAGSNAAGSAPLMASAESWITNYTSMGQGTAQTTPGYDATLFYPATAPTDSTTAGTLTEAGFKAVLAQCFINGGRPSLVMAPALVKQKISSTFTGIATRFKDVKGKDQATIVAGADVYVSDFGDLTIVPNLFMRTKTILVIDPDFWAGASLRGFEMEMLGKSGDSDLAQIVGDYTLECRDPNASGKVADINPAL